MSKAKKQAKKPAKKQRSRKRNENGNEALIEKGRGALRRDYYENVGAMAKDILEGAEKDHDDFDDASEWISERVDETVDGSSYVIYHHENLNVMVASENWLAIQDQGMGGEYSEEDFLKMLTHAAYWALHADLWEAINSDEDEYWKDRDSNPRRPSKGGNRKKSTRKPAARKPAARKPAARKPAARKPAARNPSARKPSALKAALLK